MLEQYLVLAAQLRAAGFGVELYPEAKKLGQQLKYADRRGFRVAIIMGENELAENACQVKLLSTGGTTTASLADSAKALVAELRRLLRRCQADPPLPFQEEYIHRLCRWTQIPCTRCVENRAARSDHLAFCI